MQLEQTAEQHIWRVVRPEAVDGGDCGYVAVYVDDLPLALEEPYMNDLIQAFRRAWTCSDPEFVTTGAPMRFCGFEIKKIEEGFLVGQLKVP